jgi:hypothetical protein
VKTTSSIEHYAFRRSVWDYGYDRQAALYIDGIEAVTKRKPRGFAFIAVEGKEWPEVFVQVFVMTEADIETGRRRYRKALDLMSAYQTTLGMDPQAWPKKTGPGVIEIDLSKFNS